MDREQLQKQLDRFLRYKERNWKPKTQRSNRYYFGLLTSFLGEKSFDRDNTEEFFNHQAKIGLAESTRRQAETDILAFVHWLFYEGVIEKDWGQRVERTRIHRRPRILPSQEEALELIRQATEPGKYDNRLTTFSKMEHRACLSFIVVACGGRNFETSNILRKDVSISGRQIEIAQGKGGPRTAAIPEIPWLIEELEKRVKGLRTPDELKTLSDRTHYKESDIERLFVVSEKKLEEHMRNVGKLWGRPMNVHDLRRIWARDMKKNGAPREDIQHGMGHKSGDTTDTYLEYDTSDIQKAVNKYNSEARKYRTKEEKAIELVSHAWGIGKVLQDRFDGEFLTIKVKIG